MSRMSNWSSAIANGHGKQARASRRGRQLLAAAVKASVEQLEQRRLLSAGPTAVVNGPWTFNEGGTVTLDGSGTTDDVGIVSYQWDLNYDGSNFDINATGPTVPYTAADNRADRTIALRVTDGEDQSDIATATVTVNNVAPTITITGDADVPQGQSYALSWSATDPGNDTITGWSVNWGDGNTQAYAAGVGNAAHTYQANGAKTITVSATDEDGMWSNTKSITVLAVLPVVTLTGNATVNEGANYQINFSATDAGGIDLDGWIIDWGDGSMEAYGANVTSATHQYEDEAARTVTATALSSDGDTGQATLSVTVQNAAPTVSITGAPVGTTYENSEISLGCTTADAGSTDTIAAYAWTVTRQGDAGWTLEGLDPAVATDESTLIFTPEDEGTYDVSLVVTDNDGAASTAATAAIVITNAAPTVTIDDAPGAPIAEGTLATLNSTTADAGPADTIAAYAWTVTRQGDAGWTLDPAVSTDEDSLTFTPEDEGTYEVSLIVTDNDGTASTAATETITVTNAAPTVSITGAPVGNIDEGDEVSLGCTTADAGVNDTIAAYAWTVTKQGDAGWTLDPVVATDESTLIFTPEDEGIYDVSLTVADNDGGTDTATAAITVTNAAPTVLITGTPFDAVVEGSEISLGCLAGDAGSTDTIAAYAWTVTKFGDAGWTLDPAVATDESTLVFTPEDEGTYNISLVVTDNDGDTSDPATAAISVTNAAPTVTINDTPGTPIAEGTEVTLNSTTADAGSTDTIATYVWTVTKQGDAGWALDPAVATDEASLTFTPEDEGTYNVALIVMDNDGTNSLAATETITVTNAAPTVSITDSQAGSIEEGTVVTFNSTTADAGSTDTIATYAWTVSKQGDAGWALDPVVATNEASLTFTPEDEGTYNVSLTATDNDGDSSDAATETITVTNAAPTVSITDAPAGDVEEGTAVTLNSTTADAGSTDTISVYSWTVLKQGDAGWALDPAVATDEDSLTFTPEDEGTYNVSLIVMDNDGTNSLAATETITVTNAAPTITIDDAPGAPIAEGTEVTLNSTTADAGSTDTIATYAWTVSKQGDAGWTLDPAVATDGATLVFTPEDEGTYNISLVVTDNDGDTSDPATAAISVTNAAPTVSIDDAPAGDVEEGTAVTLNSTTADAGSTDTITTYAWTVSKQDDAGWTLDPAVTTDEASLTFTPEDDGTYNVSLTVTDNDGDSSDAAAETITVTNAAPTAAITGTPAGSIVEGDSVALGVDTTDAGVNDTIVSYQWTVTKQGDPTWELPEEVATDGAIFATIVPQDGVYDVSVTVMDNDGASTTSDAVTITVTNAAPTVAITGAPAGSVEEGTAVTLGSSTADAGLLDTIASYDWTVTKQGDAGWALSLAIITNTASLNFTPEDEGTYNVTLVVTDSDGASSEAATAAIVVTNAAPVATFAEIGYFSEGEPRTLIASTSDAGILDTIASYAWTVTRQGDPLWTLDPAIVTTNPTLEFTPADEGNYDIALVVTDNDGTPSAPATATIVIDNVSPVATITGLPAGSISEGDEVSLGSIVTDEGVLDTVASYVWTVVKAGDAGWTLDESVATDEATLVFTPEDEGVYNVRLQVTDNDGGMRMTSFQGITVTNAAPAAAITGLPAGNIVEGDSVLLGAATTDAGSTDTIASYQWQVTLLGDPEWVLPEGIATDGPVFATVVPDEGVYQVTVTVMDNDGASTTSAPVTVGVDNAAPTVEITNAPEDDIEEGTEVSLGCTTADAGILDSIISYSWSVTNEDDEEWTLDESVPTDQATLVFTPEDEGAYTVSLVVTDNDGDSSEAAETTIYVINAAPTVSITGAPEESMEEGTEVTLGCTTADAGVLDSIVSYEWSVTNEDNEDWELEGSVVTDQPTLVFTPTDEGTYTISLSVEDNDGDWSEAADATITVTNVAPTVTITDLPEGSIEEGTEVWLGCITEDAGSWDNIDSYQWTVTKQGDESWTLDESVYTDEDELSFYPDDEGVYEVSLVVTDDDGDSSEAATATIIVTNAAPTAAITNAPADSIVEGDSIALGVDTTDAGENDTIVSYAWTVTRQDDPEWTLPEEVAADGPVFATFVPEDGVYQVAVTVTDNDGDSTTSEPVTVTVTNANPTVAITGAPEGGVEEGSAITLGSDVQDAGLEDVVASYVWTVTRVDDEEWTVDESVATDQASLSFTPEDEGTYQVTLTATDDDGGEGTSETTDIVVINANPTAAIDGLPSESVVEGAAIELNAVATDAGTTDTLSYAWSVTRQDDAGWSMDPAVAVDEETLQFQVTDNGTYLVQLTVSDGDGGFATSEVGSIVVTNANPAVTIEGAPADVIDEGTEVNLTSAVTDAGSDDTHTYAWTVTKADDQSWTLDEAVATDEADLTFTPTEMGSYVVALTVTDDDGGGGTAATQTITVADVAPVMTATGDGSVAEGLVFTLSIAAVDPFGDTITGYSINWGDGRLEGASGNALSATHIYADDAPRTITLIAADSDGSRGIATHSVLVTNVAPTAAVVGAPGDDINEGETVILTAAGEDVAADTISYSWSVELDGDTIHTQEGEALAFNFVNQGEYTTNLTASDEDGGSTTTTATINVVNVAPVGQLALITEQPAEGGEVRLSADVADAGPDDVLSYEWTVTKVGEAGWALDGSVATDEQELAFTPEDDGQYLVSLTVADGDGGEVSSQQTITVMNVAPTANVTGISNAVSGQKLSLRAILDDLGVNDTHQVRWDFGNGRVVDWTSATAAGALAKTHTYFATGTYTITVQVRDNDGAVGEYTRNVLVAPGRFAVDPYDASKTALYIGGTYGNDLITFQAMSGGRIALFINGVGNGVFAPTGHVIVYGGDGRDWIEVPSSLALPVEFHGGAGNDALVGGAGDDILDGGAGNDILAGRNGRDLLIGGMGVDRLDGARGDDIAIGADTALANDRVALKAIMAEWLRVDQTSIQRQNHLRGVAAGGLNGNVFLDATTIIDDLANDTIVAKNGADWYSFNSGDTLIESLLGPRPLIIT